MYPTDGDEAANEGDEAEPMVGISGVEIVKTTDEGEHENGGEGNLLRESLVEGRHNLEHGVDGVILERKGEEEAPRDPVAEALKSPDVVLGVEAGAGDIGPDGGEGALPVLEFAAAGEQQERGEAPLDEHEGEDNELELGDLERFKKKIENIF